MNVARVISTTDARYIYNFSETTYDFELAPYSKNVALNTADMNAGGRKIRAINEVAFMTWLSAFVDFAISTEARASSCDTTLKVNWI